ncbi:P-loop containing nucleoside triphosphate hydrolase protein [Helicostylum pulchrum]|nr:P-loop containing nucleoside triphosphate hydrolase protein [Helicostylum pulchrum]
MLPQTKASVDHILKHYETYKKEGRGLPMVVGLSGCQGSGKTTLCDTLAHVLKENHDLNVVQFSLDDLYLTHKDQALLSQKYKTNPLYQQRGQAGSHDLELAKQTFEALDRNEGTVAIPVYDKSLHDGKGDRLDKSQWKYVKAPVDIVLFEGWMVGFKPVQKIQDTTTLIGCTVQDALVMNQLLKKYQKDIYPFFDIFIHLSPFDIGQVYQWRLQQEHHMKSSRGVNGLSDEQVKKFVDSYMPAYQLYLPRLDKIGFEGRDRSDGGYSAPRRHLKIVLDQDRRVVESDTLLEPGLVVVKPINYTVFYRFAVVGILGLIGYKRHSIMKSIYSSWHSLKK